MTVVVRQNHWPEPTTTNKQRSRSARQRSTVPDRGDTPSGCAVTTFQWCRHVCVSVPRVSVGGDNDDNDDISGIYKNACVSQDPPPPRVRASCGTPNHWPRPDGAQGSLEVAASNSWFRSKACAVCRMIRRVLLHVTQSQSSQGSAHQQPTDGSRGYEFLRIVLHLVVVVLLWIVSVQCHTILGFPGFHGLFVSLLLPCRNDKGVRTRLVVVVDDVVVLLWCSHPMLQTEVGRQKDILDPLLLSGYTIKIVYSRQKFKEILR